MSKIPATRKRLSADALFRNIQQDFQKIPDPRTGNSPISLADTLMSGLAMFALKDPSLLAFDQRRQKDEKNLQMIFHLQDVPADTTLRETLDPFDCERNALKRFLPKFRLDHPHLRVIATLDALYANAPVIRDLRKYFVEWIIRVKQDGNKFLFKQVEQLAQCGLTEEFKILGEDGVLRSFQLAHNVPLNESNPDVLVDFLDIREPTGEDDKWRHFTFILEPLLGLCRPQAELWMQGGRARWKVENETFNTLKNQGYHLAHNYGHGYRNLSVVLVMLMMLAFLVDQTQQLGCRLFAAAWEKCISKRALWEQLREIFHQFHVSSLKAIYESVLSDRKPRLKALWDP